MFQTPCVIGQIEERKCESESQRPLDSLAVSERVGAQVSPPCGSTYLQPNHFLVPQKKARLKRTTLIVVQLRMGWVICVDV